MSKPEIKPNNVVPFLGADLLAAVRAGSIPLRQAYEINVALPSSEKVFPPDLEAAAPAGTVVLAQSIINAAEFLIKQNDVEQLRQWLLRHSAEERDAIRKYFENKGNP